MQDNNVASHDINLHHVPRNLTSPHSLQWTVEPQKPHSLTGPNCGGDNSYPTIHGNDGSLCKSELHIIMY